MKKTTSIASMAIAALLSCTLPSIAMEKNIITASQEKAEPTVSKKKKTKRGKKFFISSKKDIILENYLKTSTGFPLSEVLAFGATPMWLNQKANNKYMGKLNFNSLRINKIEQNDWYEVQKRIRELAYDKKNILEFTKIKTITLCINFLTKLPPLHPDMTNLISVNVAHNKIEQIKQEDIIHYTKLRNLNLCFNEIKELPQALSQLTALEMLYIAGNPIESVHLDFKKLPNLKKLIITQDQKSVLPNNVIPPQCNTNSLSNLCM